jgi:large subunit ribosomal protein L21
MYAVVFTGGQQFKVSQGDTLTVKRLAAEVGSSIELPVLLLQGAEGGLKVGAPHVDGAKVVAEVVEHALGEKREGFKFRHTRRYRRSFASRPRETVIRIQQISA